MVMRDRPMMRRLRKRLPRRRGVVSVLAMMFLILFGSLATAMAIMSRGNVLTAATHQHVVRALGAAETGLAVAHQRLAEAAGRFVVSRGEIDGVFGPRLWRGTWSGSDGEIRVDPPRSYPGGTSPRGLAEALAEIHARDANTIPLNGIATPTIGPAPAGTDPTVYALDAWVRTPAIALAPQSSGSPSGTAFQIEYVPLANGTDLRIIVTGYDFDYLTRGEPVSRRIMQDVTLVKRVSSAVLAPSRIMIGKNVLIEGDLGAAYTDVQHEHGDPLIMRSDFWGLTPALNAELSRLFDALRAADIDRDNRLRLHHPIEGPAIPDFGNLGYAGLACDVTDDGAVDEFDVFMMVFDRNRDGKVALAGALSAGTPHQGLSPEFVDDSGRPIDDDLALLLDSANPDRNRNGEYRFNDHNGNNRFDPGVDDLLDREEVDPQTVPPELATYIHTLAGASWLFRDQVLGYRDGVLDRRDNYAKVRGRLVVRVNDSTWTAARGDYMGRIRGTILPPAGTSALHLGASSSQLPDLTAASFTSSQTALQAAANGDGLSFDEQVAANLGIPVSQLASWTPANNPSAPDAPRYFPLLPDLNHDALPDNWQTAHYEKMPFNSPNFYDWYYRPVYENMVFRNVQIPMGNNGLFKNCTFVGVTWVRSRTTNSHPNWGLYGRLRVTDSGRPQPDPPRFIYTGQFPPTMLAPDDRPILMATTPMDKADIPANEAFYTIGYNDLPDPLIIDGRRCIDTKKFSNNIRFHDCLFVGSIVSDNPSVYIHSRNKLQFTGATRFTQRHPVQPNNPQLNPRPGDLEQIARSSMMLPNYSVDVGSFNSPPTQDVRLRGTIVAGVLDIRGNADLQGSLLLTFRPVLGEAPLINVTGVPTGNPALFNSTIGYFGPDDGDDESLDPSTLPIVNGQRIVGWDLNGDGLPDLGPHQTPTPEQLANGAAPVPFYGYGRITLRFDPTMRLPDGIMLPVQVDVRRATYRETAR